MTEYLYGMHDPGGEYLFADMPGWIVFTEAIGCDANDKSGRDYSQWSNFNILVRLNNGYGNTGTIPTPDKYDDFAIRVANFIRASKGCDTWIIGNEPNHSQERPNGQAITPAMYIDCYKRVHGTVRIAGVGTRHGLIPAPVALWNVETGDWLEYQETVWRALWKLSAGVALHTYTHGPSPSLITSPETMQAPFQNRYYHFRAYRDLMNRVPTEARGLPAYITETDQNDPWNDANSGWVQEAYKEIDRWNQSGLQKIHCLALYRWPKADQWGIVDKPGVHADLRAAVGKGYTSPTMGATTMSDNTTFIPAVSNGTQVPALPPSYPADWDPRLTERGVKIERVLPGAPGTLRWRVTKGVWMDEKESQGRHHFYADVYADNEPVVGAILAARWPGDGYATFPMEAKPGEEPGANFPMSKSRNEFSFQVNEPKHPSDVVTGVGMGAATPDGGYNIGIHTSTYIEWTLDRTPLASSPPAPTGPTAPMWVAVPAGARLRGAPTTNANVLQAIPFGQKVDSFGTEMAQGAPWNHVIAPDGQQGWILGVLLSPTEPANPGPTPPVKPVVGDAWQRSREFVRRWEGGYQNNPADKGNWTECEVGKGDNRGTKFGISACSYPKLDIQNLSMEEADAIYARDYWRASGADKLPWPYCLYVFDTAVLHGVGTARKWQEAAGNNAYAFAAKRLHTYTKLDNWKDFGAGWVNRTADLLEEASKL